MQNNRRIKITTGTSRKSLTWIGQELYWSDFITKLSQPIRTEETLQDYKNLSKPEQDRLKDVGGFVGGVLTGQRRKNENGGERHLITLDADTIEPGGAQQVLNRVSGLGCAYTVYSTRKHEGAAPRLRIIVPLDEPCSAEEYEPIARRLASYIGMQIFDPTTFEAVRLMYWPSCSVDSEYLFCYEDKPFLSRTGMLSTYVDWQNVAEWPEVPGAAKLRDRSANKQGDPLAKKGVVGAFCRQFSIEDAMERFLPGIYEPDADAGRFTYTGGTTVGGAVLYDNGKFLYSHHATDPCSGKLVNSFDLVRLHRFGDLDDEAKPDTPTNRLPSYDAMVRFALDIPEVNRAVAEDKLQMAAEAFGDSLTPTQEPGIMKAPVAALQDRLELTEKGAVKSTPGNVNFILSSDKRFLQGRVVFEEFTGRTMLYGQLPGSPRTGPRKWDDKDDSWLADFLCHHFGIKGEKLILHGLNRYLELHSVHVVRNYLNSLVWDGVPRIDRLLSDYLGAADTEYTRTVIRLTLCAAAARIYHPGTKFDSMPVLYGPPGIGKSTFARMLAGDHWFSDSLTISDMRDKSAAEKLQGYLIMEIPELAGMYNADLEMTKSFMSRTVDIYRPAYGRNTIERPRQCVFIGTTNKEEFLKDKTGNRRFWPVRVGLTKPGKSVWEDLKMERDQIWAEAVCRVRIGQPLYMDERMEQIAQEIQQEHLERDPREEQILDFVERKITEDWYQKDFGSRVAFWGFSGNSGTVERTRISAIEVWCECLHGAKELFNKKEAAWINDILRAMPGWESGHVRLGNAYSERARGFYRVVTFNR